MHPAIKKVYLNILKLKNTVKVIDEKISIVTDKDTWGAKTTSIEITGDNSYKLIGYYTNAKGAIRFIKNDKDENLHGKTTGFYKHGPIKYEGEYINNMKNGEWTYYKSDGNIDRIEKFENGKKI